MDESRSLLGWSAWQWSVARQWALDNGRKAYRDPIEYLTTKYPDDALRQTTSDDIRIYGLLQEDWRIAHHWGEPAQSTSFP